MKPVAPAEEHAPESEETQEAPTKTEETRPPSNVPENTQKAEEAKTPAELWALQNPSDTVLSIDDPQSTWVISNKQRPLNPENYEPTDLFYPDNVFNTNNQPLRYEAAVAVENLVEAADSDGVFLAIISAYRSYDLQDSLYNSYISRDGQAAADRYSARPGHSEHQTGLVVDFDDLGGCGLMQCFEETQAGVWLKRNAHNYGFIMRYPNGFEHTTGFMYEPWHFRYVGLELASAIHNSGVATLEEWFGLPDAPDYDYDW